ncbi:PREDICTED: zinc finger protein RFP-like, partial [Calidris pugnax]|uniref:zinc finger protein RFP-like n=1 Tax=Calidris pugnax TaxID=198806 RepID=UPI00071DB8FC
MGDVSHHGILSPQQGKTTDPGWPKLSKDTSSDQCRETGDQKSLRPNWELANVIEAAKRLNLPPVREVEGGENLCEEHQEPLKLFCQDDKKLICVVCDRSEGHHDHSVVPIEEAAQEYKKKTTAAKQKVVMTYRKLHELLEKQESSLLAQLEQLDTEIRNTHEEIFHELLEERTSLGTLTGEMERVYQQPDWQLLKDIRTTLSRGQRESLSHSLDISLELEKKFSDFTEKTAAIKEALEKFQDFLEFELPLTTQMTLDPRTANGRLYLSEDCKLMRWEPFDQDLPSKPWRFKVDPCKKTTAAKQKVVMTYRKLHELLEKQESSLLAQLEQLDTEIRNTHEEIFHELLEERTSLGTLIGEMERVYQQPDRQLLKDIRTTLSRGQRESLSHSLDISLELEKKFSDFTEKTAAIKEALEKFQDFLEFELPLTTQMTLDPRTANGRLYLSEDCKLMRVPKRIRICLDYEEGRVVFFDAESKEQIFVFPQASFQGERVFPWFM